MKKRIHIPVLVLALLLSACNNWLDVTPLGEVDENRMFDEPIGFYQSLAGSYSLLVSYATYGDQLTAGFVEQIVQYWKDNGDFGKFDYTTSTSEATLSATWNKMYETIANINLLTDNLKSWDEADMEDYALVKGEALGLRAYLHLDLLRLFGPVLTDGLDQASIPYRDQFSNSIRKRMSAKEVIARIIEDLEEAYRLLQDDPIKVYGRKYSGTALPKNTHFAYRYRGLRMNYYAVCATLARVHMLAGEKAKALQYAEEIIQANTLFRLLADADMNEAKKDALFQMELIWALYDPEIESPGHLAFQFSLGGYTYEKDLRTYIYRGAQSHGATGDFRDQENLWWLDVAVTPPYSILRKYKRNYDQGDYDITPWDKVIPMIRLSEIYYIAAEANLGTNNARAYELLNLVRKARNLDPLPAEYGTDQYGLLEQIIYEYQKEFWGEGKLFYTYKRLNHNIIVRDATIPVTRAIFELPIPKDEIEFGGN